VNARQLLDLIREAIARLELDLSERTVVTEAATGAYAATPVIAALAGARHVQAVARGSAAAAAYTQDLAAYAGVRVEVVTNIRDAAVDAADIVTNSGRVRPLDAATVARMRPGAAIPLMYETWELRASDVDVDACRARGVRVAGTNECHPDVGVFSYLGPMAVKLLSDAGVALPSARLLVLCDNPFRPFLEQGLQAAGAHVEVAERVPAGRWDAVLVALQPRGPLRLPASAAPVVAQLWGDLDRDALRGVRVWPPVAPAPGHMGILPSALGPEPVVRLQAGGLKVGELLCRGCLDHAVLQPV